MITMNEHEKKEWPLPDALKGVSRIAFLGDSLTDGSDYPDIVVNTLNKVCPGQRFISINAGVGGHTSDDLLDRVDRDVLSQKTDLTFIFIGTNDRGHISPANYKANLLYLARCLKAVGSKVAFISLTATPDMKDSETYAPYNAIIREVVQEEQTMFVDALPLFRKWQGEGRALYYTPTDCHHSLDGMRAMGRAVLMALGVPESVEMDLAITPPANLLTKWEDGFATNNPADPSQVATWTSYDPAPWIDTQDWWWKQLSLRGAVFPMQGDRKAGTPFARTMYQAPKDDLFELQLGGHGIIVWINGVKVYTMPKSYGCHPNAVRVPVMLKKGKNEIAVTAQPSAFVGVRGWM